MSAQFIAEVSSNHNGSLERSLRFVDCAAALGCAAVKFQLFRVDRLFAPEVLARSARHRARRQWELPVDWLPALARHCRERGVAFGCTPFDLGAVEQLAPHVDFLKVASYELLWHDLLRACGATGKPLILSTGMATADEVSAAVATVASAAAGRAASAFPPLTLLHCVSGYPTPPEQCQLGAIGWLRREFGAAVGWSDHSVHPGVIHRAVSRWGAATVEFHLDLDGDGWEFSGGHCWLPDAIAAVIADVVAGAAADGDESKRPVPVELPDRGWRADPDDGLRPLKSTRERLGATL